MVYSVIGALVRNVALMVDLATESPEQLDILRFRKSRLWRSLKPKLKCASAPPSCHFLSLGRVLVRRKTRLLRRDSSTSR